MMRAISHNCTICLNASNHPSIPSEGLELTAQTLILVTRDQALYLRSLPGVDLVDEAAPEPDPQTPERSSDQ